MSLITTTQKAIGIRDSADASHGPTTPPYSQATMINEAPFTVGGWFKPTSEFTTTRYIFSLDTDTSSQMYTIHLINGTIIFRKQYNVKGDIVMVNLPVLNEWQYAGLAIDSLTQIRATFFCPATMSVPEQQTKSDCVGPSIQYGDGIWLGCQYNSWLEFKGRVGHWAAWNNYALSDEELYQLALGEYPTAYPTYLDWYDPLIAGVNGAGWQGYQMTEFGSPSYDSEDNPIPADPTGPEVPVVQHNFRQRCVE